MSRCRSRRCRISPTGDEIWIKADLPATQSERYLMVVTFLRGPTNPPTKNWFFECETWKKSCANGMKVTIPEGAQQALIFLAPETGGDFKTLVNAVRGRPGAFVRATQDLNQATLDRSRLERYLGGDPRAECRQSRSAEGHHTAAGAQPRHPRR